MLYLNFVEDHSTSTSGVDRCSWTDVCSGPKASWATFYDFSLTILIYQNEQYSHSCHRQTMSLKVFQLQTTLCSLTTTEKDDS